MPHPVNATMDLVSAALLHVEAIPEGTRCNTKNVVLDTLGCMLGSVATPQAAAVYRYLMGSESRGEVSVVGSTAGATPEAAAYANAILAHILELDDTHRTAIMHPAAPIIGAALAVAELRNVDGEKFLKSIVFGYEVGSRIGVAIQPSHWYKGYLSMATCGAVGAAAACAYMMGMGASKIAQAIGIAAIQAGGLNVSIFAKGDMGKITTPASGAGNGVKAAFLVESGFTGPETVIEGRFGILDVWAQSYDWASATTSLGLVYEIDRTGLKPFSCCRYIHGPLELLGQLVNSNDLKAEQIASIEVRTYDAAVLKRPHRPEPLSMFDAKNSIPYCLAVQLDRGNFSDAIMADGLKHLAHLGQIARKVTVLADHGMTASFPAKWPSSVTITTVSGDVFSQALDYPKGEPENPLSSKEVIQKFRLLSEPFAGDQGAGHIIDAVYGANDKPFVAAIAPYLRSPYSVTPNAA